jgi:hypothetical protein
MAWNKAHVEPVTRWCSACWDTPLIVGGMYVTFNNGKNRRWICMSCKEKRDERRVNKGAN